VYDWQGGSFIGQTKGYTVSNVANLRLNDVIRINYSLTDFVVGTITNISGNNVSLLISNQGNQSYVVGALVTDIPSTFVYTGVTPLNGRTNLPSACIITGLQGNYAQSAFGQAGTITATVNTASSGNLAGLTYSMSSTVFQGFTVTQLLSVPIGTGVFCNGPSPYTVAFSTTTNSVSWRTTTTQGGNTYFGEILGYNLAYNSGTVQILGSAKQTTFSIATTGVRHESFTVGTDTVVRCFVDTSATGTITFLNPNKTSSDPISLRVLLVGGGGAGGKATTSFMYQTNFHGGGGGGGGRVVDTTTQTFFSQAHSFGIGVGGFNFGTAYSTITSSTYAPSTQSFFNELSAGGGGTGVHQAKDRQCPVVDRVDSAAKADIDSGLAGDCKLSETLLGRRSRSDRAPQDAADCRPDRHARDHREPGRR
jgi:hypothetical protein